MNPDAPSGYAARSSKLILLGAGLQLAVGGQHLGPKTVAVDRFYDRTAIADSSTGSPYL
jgi:formate-dependent phosphoribosylglycinamide formyltransferase (GAR transformylase)